MLLLSVLSVFAVKILGKLGSEEDAFATDEHGIPRKKEEKNPSVIFANAEIHIYSKSRMDPRIREGDQGARRVKKKHLPRIYTEINTKNIFTAKTQRAQSKT